MSSPPESQPEREKTDRGLRSERISADQALQQRRSAEATADKLVEQARSQADAVLDQARGKADDKLDAAGSVLRVLHDAVASERAQEDAILRSERDMADARLQREREKQAALLTRDRTNTDRYLLAERDRSDDAIANRDDFLGMACHDLRNLLNNVSMHAFMLATAAPASPEGLRTTVGVERIQHEVSRMSRIIGDLVDVVSIDAGKLSVLPQPGDAAILLAECVDAFAQAAAAKGISLSVESGTASLPACFDSQRLYQVLSNFLSNAVKFTPDGGRIVIHGKVADDGLHLWVSDTGPGIAPDMLEDVFERFWQTGKNDRRGLGLGLHISRCIVDGHGGRIWAESTVGVGSTFHCRLPPTPLAAPSLQGGTGAQKPDPGGHTSKW